MPLKGSLSEKLLWMAISFPVPKHAMGAAPAGAAFQQVCHPPPLPLSALMAASPSPWPAHPQVAAVLTQELADR